MADYTAISTAVKDSFDWRPIDILVNNAGVTISGLIQDLSAGDLQTVVQTNFLGSVYALHAVLPQLVLRSRDHPVSIVFMGSLASLVRECHIMQIFHLNMMRKISLISLYGCQT